MLLVQRTASATYTVVVANTDPHAGLEFHPVMAAPPPSSKLLFRTCMPVVVSREIAVVARGEKRFIRTMLHQNLKRFLYASRRGVRNVELFAGEAGCDECCCCCCICRVLKDIHRRAALDDVFWTALYQLALRHGKACRGDMRSISRCWRDECAWAALFLVAACPLSCAIACLVRLLLSCNVLRLWCRALL